MANLKIAHIKKYENRRLYSTDDKRYVTIQEVEQKILDGFRVKILEVETDRDITSEVLTQILLEKGGFIHFPVEALEHLIRANDAALNTMWGQFMAQSFGFFLQMQNDMGKAYKKLFAAFAAKK